MGKNQVFNFYLCSFTKEKIRLRVGEYDFEEQGETAGGSATYEVQEIRSHAGTRVNDLCIIKIQMNLYNKAF